MALSLGTVMTVIDIVNRAIDTYKTIDAAPEQMSKLAKRMQRLQVYLVTLERFIRRKATHALARLRDGQRQELASIVEDIKTDAEKVRVLFQRWKNDIGPLGLQFRFKVLTQAYFALGTSMEKVQELIQDIELHKQDLRDYLQLMGAEGIEAILEGQAASAAAGQGAVLAALPAGAEQVQAQGPSLNPPGNSAMTTSTSRAKLSPSPSPAPPRRDYKLLFVDPHNTGRSVAAMAVMNLIKEWTQRTGGDWRLSYAHSAGFFVRSRSDLTDTIESMAYSRKAWKKAVVPGGEPPKQVAMDAVFDNKLYNYPFKKTVKEGAAAHRSRGLTRRTFQQYDLVLVFTGREHDNMIQLRKVLRGKDGDKSVTPSLGGRGGRVLHLGAYLGTASGFPQEIFDPHKDKTGQQTRADWNKAVGQIKTALKAFLKQEMHWTQPVAGAVVKG